MRRKLLDVLGDPETGEPLSLVDDDGRDEIDDGWLESSSGSRYPIRGGIPRFVAESSYADSFGLQWNRFAKVQLDSMTGAAYSRRRFDAEVCWAKELDGEWVVDAGCGSGRFAEIAASYGADVIAADLSSAVDAAAANLRHLPNVHVVQADLRRLPLRRDAVRHLYSIGVLQHTPEPVASARRLVEQLPVGGRFCFTIYGRRPWTRLYSKYWWRPLTTRMQPDRLLSAVERLMPVLFPLTSVLFRLPVVGRLFQFVIPVANYTDRAEFSRDQRYQEAVLDTFDMLSPRYDRPITLDELTVGLGDLADLTAREAVPVVACGVRR